MVSKQFWRNISLFFTRNSFNFRTICVKMFNSIPTRLGYFFHHGQSLVRKGLNKSCENKMALKVRKSDNMQIWVRIPLLSVPLKFRPLNTGQTDSFSLAGGSGILAEQIFGYNGQEISELVRSYFRQCDDFILSFWNLLTFNARLQNWFHPNVTFDSSFFRCNFPNTLV